MDSELAGRVQVPDQDSCLVTTIVNSVGLNSVGLCFMQDSQVLKVENNPKRIKEGEEASQVETLDTQPALFRANNEVSLIFLSFGHKVISFPLRMLA